MNGLFSARWRWLAIPVLVIPVTWLLFAGIGKDPREIPSPLIGKPLPAFAGETLDGSTFSTDALDGRPALVNVWASWCSPCVQEHPLLLDLADRYGNELAIVGIIYQDTAPGAQAFLDRYGDGGYPDLLDADGRIAVDLGVTGPPETFFVDASGVVRSKHVGPLTEAVLDEQLAAIGVGR
jgi:cytochrome c biogenesis protein CcmG/thiol:disulfide interchange protein DsbE